VAADGTVEVPRGPGLGVEVDMPYVEERTDAVERFAR